MPKPTIASYQKKYNELKALLSQHPRKIFPDYKEENKIDKLKERLKFLAIKYAAFRRNCENGFTTDENPWPFKECEQITDENLSELLQGAITEYQLLVIAAKTKFSFYDDWEDSFKITIDFDKDCELLKEAGKVNSAYEKIKDALGNVFKTIQAKSYDNLAGLLSKYNIIFQRAFVSERRNKLDSLLRKLNDSTNPDDYKTIFPMIDSALTEIKKIEEELRLWAPNEYYYRSAKTLCNHL